MTRSVDYGDDRLACSTAEAAEWLSLPESLLDDAVAAGVLPVVRVGRRQLRIPIAALDDFLVRAS